MSIQFVWKDKYSVGDLEIDKQHKGLFELGNELPEVSGEQDVKPIIMQLFKYTREHFSAEEEMMNRIGFTYLAKHKKLHGGLKKASGIGLDVFTKAISDKKEQIRDIESTNGLTPSQP